VSYVPFETTRATLHDARQPSALAGFFSRRVKPHALRHTEQSIWMDQTRRHGRALRDTRKPRRWAMTPRNESIPSEFEAAGQAYVPRSESPMRSTNLRAERWINKGVALVCSECETTETSQRYANRDDKGKPVCYVCYMLQLAVSHGKCSGCSNDGGNTSQLRRSKVEKDAWYCMPCIHREVRISRFFFLSLCLLKRSRRHDNFRRCFVSTQVVEFHILRRSWTLLRPRGRRA